ncbi:hypothetical protein ITJ58_17660, partial [Curtobacterium flaccumfaciens]|uniref:hypothetical protein n=1 Tax=Curtobacterium flaccumfaciens TaxID=2035 RepID=UPI00188A9079
YYTANTDGTAAGGFVPVAGKRIVDTRSGLGAPKALLAPGKSVDIQVTGANGVPAGASGAVVNLLPINSTSSDGYLTPYATGTTRPDNALHYAPSANTSIQAQVRLSSSGKMTIYNGSSTINLVIDLQGYFTAAGTTGATFTPGIGRVFDSRATGNTILAKNETRAIQVAGQAGVPVMGSGITAVVLTLTAAHGGSEGRASVWANGTTQPETTSINFQTDEIRTNTVTVALGANGKINLNNIADPTNYVIDVQGWYSNPAAPIISCPGFSSGSWSTAVPDDDISCSVNTPAASESGQNVVLALDGSDLDPVALSETAATTTATEIPGLAGTHTITARVQGVSGAGVGPTSSYSVTLGDWANKQFTSSPGVGETTPRSPSLSVTANGNDDFLPDVQFRYIVTTNPNSFADAAVDSGWLDGAFDIAQGVLAAKSTYYWRVEVKGTSGAAAADVTSPTYSFVTNETDNVAEAEETCAAMADEAIANAQAAGVTDESDDQYVACSDTTVQVDSLPSGSSSGADASASVSRGDSSAPLVASSDTASATTFAYNVATEKGVDLTGLSDSAATAAVNSIQPNEDEDGDGSNGGATPDASETSETSEASEHTTDRPASTILLATVMRRASGSPAPGGLSSTYRTINSKYKETIGAVMAYGLKRKGKWVSKSTIKNTVVLNLGYMATARVTYSWVSLSKREIAATVRPTLYVQRGWLEPGYVDGIIIGSDRGHKFTFREKYSETGYFDFNRGPNKYHIEPRTLEVNDLAYGHQFRYLGSLGTGHRWQCYKTVVCKFPRGKEASSL